MTAYELNKPLFSYSDVKWREDMIRDLREALKFYANADRTLVDLDNGKVARDALEKKQ
jgi:hypothetical protein